LAQSADPPPRKPPAEAPRSKTGKDASKPKKFEIRTVCGPRRRCERRRENVRVCGPVRKCQRRYQVRQVCDYRRVCRREYDSLKKRYEERCRQRRVCDDRTLPATVCVTEQACRWVRRDLEDCRSVTVCRKRRVPVTETPPKKD
jgi:hypothetical protein